MLRGLHYRRTSVAPQASEKGHGRGTLRQAGGARGDVSAEEQHRVVEASRRLDGRANAAGPRTYRGRSGSLRFIEQRLPDRLRAILAFRKFTFDRVRQYFYC